MPTRFVLAAVAAACLALPASAQAPKIGTQTLIEYTEKTPSTGGYHYMDFPYAIEQGDKFRIQVEAFKGADMTFWVVVYQDGGKMHEMTSHNGSAKIDFTMTKGLPGRKASIRIGSKTPGKVNVLIRKVGEEPADEPKDAEIKKLKDENAALKKKLDEMQRQLADIKRLLEKKK